MEQLPLEMIHHILHFLPLRDKIQNRVVCKTFRDLLPDLKLDPSEKRFIKKSVIELASICLIPEIVMGGINIIQPFKFQIVDPKGQIKHRVDVSNYISNGQILIRREIIIDQDSRFSDLDDLDPYFYYDGLKKFLCTIQNILSICGKHDTLFIHGRDWLWQEMSIRFILNPIQEYSNLSKKYESILSSHLSDLDYISSYSYLIINSIYQILSPRFKQIREQDKKEYLVFVLN